MRAASASQNVRRLHAHTSNRRAQPAPRAASVLANSARSPRASRPLLRPKSQARCALEENHAHPSLARGCPRRQSSLARLRALCGSAPPWGAALRALRCAQARASATASPHAGRAQAAPRCWAAPTRAERVRPLRAAVGIGQAVPPQARSAGGACLRSRRSRVWRSARSPPRPRLAPLAPRRVRLRLAPSPRSRRRAKPPAPFAFPSRAAACRFCRHPATPTAFPRHVAHRAPPAWKGSRCSRH